VVVGAPADGRHHAPLVDELDVQRRHRRRRRRRARRRTRAHAGLSESDNVDGQLQRLRDSQLSGGRHAVSRDRRREGRPALQLRAPLCSVDESGRVVLGSREAFTVYDARHGIAMYRFRVKGTLPPHFTAIRWSGECVVTLEQRGVRVFRVLPLLSDTNGTCWRSTTS
jgi:hypothetical protein